MLRVLGAAVLTLEKPDPSTRDLHHGFPPLIVSHRFSVVLVTMWTRCGRKNSSTATTVPSGGSPRSYRPSQVGFLPRTGGTVLNRRMTGVTFSAWREDGFIPLMEVLLVAGP